MHRDDLSKEFNLQTFKQLVTGLVETELYSEAKDIHHNSSLIKSAQNIGHFLDNRFNNILVITHSATVSARVKLATDTFKLMAENNIDKALIAYVSTTDPKEWRFSYVSISLEESKGKIKRFFTNPRRQSYLLGQNAKTLTPYKYLVSNGKANDINELQKRFSLEVVNNDFYKEIAHLYDRLVGSSKIDKEITYPGNEEESHEFTVRLIGRLIFCWFLREKKSANGIPLIPHDLLSRKASVQKDYYDNTLAPLFFEILNTRIEKRNDKYLSSPYNLIPYLNGGLFNNDDLDYYRHNTQKDKDVCVPDAWLRDLIDLLERYNFTVDENTSYDTDLSIDPEMLGRVFENLLARINPETGETVRKSTGSFYTPREVVDYMVGSSLVEYLSNTTTVPRTKLFALASYDLTDDLGNELTDNEKSQILESISTLTVIDPACGSGAFPIGMLQKILHVISIVDPNAEWWLEKQLEGVSSPELKQEFDNKSANYIRKLGIIRKTIFGVDIQPIATEISRLRCFLTLIVDEAIDDNKYNRGIRPLPNLDFKIMQGNSLIEEYAGIEIFDEELIFNKPEIHSSNIESIRSEQYAVQREYLRLHSSRNLTPLKQMELQSKLKQLEKRLRDIEKNKGRPTDKLGLFDAYSKAHVVKEMLKKHHQDYFACSDNQKKNEIKEKINSTEWELIEETLRENNNYSELERLNRFKKSRTRPFFIWKLNFPDVFENGGFDIVIANPPYLREKNNKATFEPVNTSTFGKKYHQGKMDFWYYFLHKAIDISKDEGIISYITSRYWLNSSGSRKLIQRISKELSFVELVDIGKLKVFDSVAGQHMVATYIKSKTNDDFLYKKLENDISDINKVNQSNNLSIKTLSSSKIISPNFEIIFEHSSFSLDNTIKLGEVCNTSIGIQESPDKITTKHLLLHRNPSINVGDGVFVLTEDEMMRLNLNNYEMQLVKKYLDPNDVLKYAIKWSRKYLIYADKDAKNLISNDQSYHNIRSHLDKFTPYISSSNKPYGLHRPRDASFFIKPKIIFKGMFKECQFTYDDKGYYTGFSFSLITQKNKEYDLKYILALLNSKLALDWFFNNGKKRGVGVDIGVEKLRLFPVKIVDSATQAKVVILVDKILVLKNSSNDHDARALELKLDALVNEIYGLSEEEKKLIQDSE